MFCRAVKTLLTNADVRRSLCEYALSGALHMGKPRLRTRGFVLSGFPNFTEFHSTRCGLDASSEQFFTNISIPDGAILDVGANYGVVAMMLAQRYPERMIHAFEPNPAVLAVLNLNLAANGIRNVAVDGTAVGDTCGYREFMVLEKGSATSHFRVGSENGRLINVPVTKLDVYAAQRGLTNIGLMKVDVEGHESAVFKGAQHLLENKAIRMIYFEVCADMTRLEGYDPVLPGRILSQHGYQLRRFSDGEWIPAKAEDMATEKWANWLATGE
jgi:FkbM family methyltransferase